MPRTNSSKTETLFHTYSQYAHAGNLPAEPSADQKQTEAKINELFEKVSPTAALQARNRRLTP